MVGYILIACTPYTVVTVTAEVSSLTRLTNDAFRFKTPVFGSNAES